VGGGLLNVALGTYYAWSVFVPALEREFGWTRTQTSLVPTIDMVMLASMFMVAGLIQDRVGPRTVATLGGVLFSGGLFLASYTTSLTTLYLTWGLMVGAGLGFGYLAPITVGGVLGHRAAAMALGIAVMVLSSLFTAFCVHFFRDPERPLPTDAKKIYSPGDGRVMSVAREGPGDVVTLRIFLSVFDVHIQRAPCAGTVEKVQPIAGSFAMAMKDEAKGNARCVMTLLPEGRTDRLVVEQIAGLVARRIECWPQVGAKVRSGERYGIIYFGSQAAVHFPASAKCTVKPGDRVTGALTQIGEWTS